MAAGTWIMFDQAKKYLTDGTVDWDGATLKVALHNSSTAYTSASMTTYSATNELATANGYANGGAIVTGPSVVVSGTTTKLTASAIPSWAITGAPISARYGVLYAYGTYNSVTNPAIGYVLLDITPADVTVAAGSTLQISVPANGFFTLT